MPGAAVPKLASRPKSIYTRSRVFVHPSLAAESLQKNVFAYSGFASGPMYTGEIINPL